MLIFGHFHCPCIVMGRLVDKTCFGVIKYIQRRHVLCKESPIAFVGKVLPQKAEPLPVHIHLASPVRFCGCESGHQREGVGESVVCHLLENGTGYNTFSKYVLITVLCSVRYFNLTPPPLPPTHSPLFFWF